MTRLYSLAEVAALTDTPLATVRRWVKEQRLPVVRKGPLRLKRVRVTHATLLAYFPRADESVTPYDVCQHCGVIRPCVIHDKP